MAMQGHGPVGPTMGTVNFIGYDPLVDVLLILAIVC